MKLIRNEYSANGIFMKKCSKCKKIKQTQEFNPDKRSKDGCYSSCRICKNKECATYRKNNPDKIKTSGKKWRDKNPTWFRENDLKNEYGMSLNEYNQMFNNQNGCCAICKKHQSNFKKVLAVDHSHKTGKVRKLLCHKCNNAIGLFLDNSQICYNAGDYLREFNT